MPGLLCCCCICLRCCLPPSSMSPKSARAGARGRVGSRVGERLDMCGRSQAMCPGPNRIGAARSSTATAMVGLVGEATRALSLHRLASPCRRQGDGKHQLTSSENQRLSLATSAPPRGARLSPLRRQKHVAGRQVAAEPTAHVLHAPGAHHGVREADAKTSDSTLCALPERSNTNQP